MLGSQCMRAKGMEKKKVLPLPSADSTPIVPPAPSTYHLAMLSPNPDTPDFWTHPEVTNEYGLKSFT
jgi:hypothetical protein